MATTAKLGLKLVGVSAEDLSQTFLKWRTDMCGLNTGSNMQVIDRAYGELKDAETAILSGKQDDARYHLGFYLDENGDLCQVDD